MIHKHTGRWIWQRSASVVSWNWEKILLSIQTGFNLVNAAVVCAILKSISGLKPSSVITEPRYLKLVTVSSFCPFALLSVLMPLFFQEGDQMNGMFQNKFRLQDNEELSSYERMTASAVWKLDLLDNISESYLCFLFIWCSRFLIHFLLQTFHPAIGSYSHALKSSRKCRFGARAAIQELTRATDNVDETSWLLFWAGSLSWYKLSSGSRGLHFKTDMIGRPVSPFS